MNQQKLLSPHKFSLIPGNITRLFLLLMVLLLVSLGVIVQSSVNVWLKDKSYEVTEMAKKLHKRIDTYRYITWQIYDNIAVSTNPPNTSLQETRLRPDISYLEKPLHKTEALIYGVHDNTTLEMSDRISDYLDTLWGMEQIPWTFYYLNGQDNSLILISTLPLKDRATNFKEPDIRSLIESRRAELLQQANALDVRESFSALRFLSWQNGYYLTLRTTFNQPGHLATVVAFDLPVGDLVSSGMLVNNFQISNNNSMIQTIALHNDGLQEPGSVHVNFNGSHIEISSPVISTRLNLVWQATLTTLLADTLQNSLLPLLINIALLALVLFGYTVYRYPPASQEKPDNNNALHLLRALNEEIIALLPVGLLVYDKETNRMLASNKIADHLLPHLDLINITALAEQHQGVIQATINNELYEIRLFYSQITPNTQIFILRDQDREMLANSKLKQAKKLYEKNQLGCSQFMHNLGRILRQPLEKLEQQVAALPALQQSTLQAQLQVIIGLIEDIRLLNALETGSWKKCCEPFAIQPLLDDLVIELLPRIKDKDLRLLMNNTLPVQDMRTGDRQALRIMLMLLMKYAITTTQFGRITLNITEEGKQLCFTLLDSGNGFSRDETENLYFPFLNATSADEVGMANGLAFHLCNTLAGKFGGHLQIQSHSGLGTQYKLLLILEPHADESVSGEYLLDDMVAMVDICPADVRELVIRRLSQWGARCITPDENITRQEYDILFTDNPSNLTASGVLLSDDDIGVQHYGAGKWRVNFNISSAMQEAVLQLIEEQLVLEDTSDSPREGDDIARFYASGYYPLFAGTVPEDVQKLYSEFSEQDFAALAQTAHRLKGVFAMLNLLPGKQLCETLEHHIREKDEPAIEKDTSDLDLFVKRLLSQGSLNE